MDASKIQFDSKIRDSVVEDYERRLSEMRAREAMKPATVKTEWRDPSPADVPEEAEAAKETGMALAAGKVPQLVQAAQSVARKLGQYGAVTIDDVVHEMKRLGYDESKIGPGCKDAPKNWKGSVFSSGEWVCTGSISSREKTAHGRLVRQWCLKSWLGAHPVNGSDSPASAFSIFKILQEARRFYTHGEKIALFVGRNMLDMKFAGVVSPAGGERYDRFGRRLSESRLTMFGVDVYVFDGVGAYAAEIADGDRR